MSVRLRAIPVVFACQGCELDAAAKQAAADLDRRGEAEASIMGSDLAKARSRYPILALEGCDKCCATRWLAQHGVAPQETRILESGSEPDSPAPRNK